MADALRSLLAETSLRDVRHPESKRWLPAVDAGPCPPGGRIGAVYDFARTEIALGYNQRVGLPAFSVLADGIGQCNTKSTLLHAADVSP